MIMDNVTESSRSHDRVQFDQPKLSIHQKREELLDGYNNVERSLTDHIMNYSMLSHFCSSTTRQLREFFLYVYITPANYLPTIFDQIPDHLNHCTPAPVTTCRKRARCKQGLQLTLLFIAPVRTPKIPIIISRWHSSSYFETEDFLLFEFQTWFLFQNY
jgi:hypothetical protein